MMMIARVTDCTITGSNNISNINRGRCGRICDFQVPLSYFMQFLVLILHLNSLCQDLDAETAAHIEADCLAQTKAEEAEFYRDLLDQVRNFGHSNLGT